MIAVDNINEHKRAEQERYLSNCSVVLLKLFDRVYCLDYDQNTVELLHCHGDDFIKPNTPYSLESFFQRLETVTSPEDLKNLKMTKCKSSLDQALAHSANGCLTLHYVFADNKYASDITAFFFKADLVDGKEHYLCCVKKNV